MGMSGGALSTLVVRLVGDTKQFHSSMGGAVSKMTAVSSKMTAIGKKMTKGLTVPILAIGASSVFAFAKFDDAMTSSLAIMGEISGPMRKKMETAARDVGKTTSFSATQAAEAYFFLASAGLDAAQSIGALPKVAAFAQAGNFDLAQATDLLTDAQSALGLTSDDTAVHMENMARVSDVLVKANTLANASVQQFSEAITSKLGAGLRSMNKPIEEGVAVLSALADQGLKGAGAGEALTRVMEELQVKALDNTKAFEKYGVTVYDSTGKMRNMADVVADVEKATAGMSDEQVTAMYSELGLQKRSMATMKQLTGTSDAIRKYEADLHSAGGITDEVANKQMQGFWKQMGLVKDKLVDAAITIGSVLAPKLKSLADFVGKVADKFSSMSPKTQDMIIKFGLVVAAIGPVLMVGGKLIRTVGKIAGAIKGVINLGSKFIGFFSRLGGGMTTSLGPVANTQTAWVGLNKAGKTVGKSTATLGSKLSGLAGPLGIAGIAAGGLAIGLGTLYAKNKAASDAFYKGISAATEHGNAMDNLKSKVADLTVGTQEYNDALEAQRVKAEEIIDQTNTLFAIYDETGRVVDVNTDAMLLLNAALGDTDQKVADLSISQDDSSTILAEAIGLTGDYTTEMAEQEAEIDRLITKIAGMVENNETGVRQYQKDLEVLVKEHDKAASSTGASLAIMEENVVAFGKKITGPQGMSAMSTEDINNMLAMMSHSSPLVKEQGLNMFQQIIEAEKAKDPEIAAGMQAIMTGVEQKIKELPAGQRTAEKMAELVQSEIDAQPAAKAEMERLGIDIAAIIDAYDVTTNPVTSGGYNATSFHNTLANVQDMMNRANITVPVWMQNAGQGGGGGGPKRHGGGDIPSSGWYDLDEGEGVLQRSAMRRLGAGVFRMLNRGILPVARGAGATVTIGDIHFHSVDPEYDVAQVRRLLGETAREANHLGRVLKKGNG